MNTRIISTISVLALCASAMAAESEGWVKLFDGETLKGWTQKNGTATYRVEDGAIVGKTAEGSPNSFLCTEAVYSDFELEFDVRVDSALNSGVQIRSKTKPANDSDAGRVYGPQVEIEAGGEQGAEAGYVYGEATKYGWLTPPERLKPHKHFRDGKYNHYRIVAKGPRIQTWINGEPIEDLTHDEIYKAFPSGFIGLQVHGIAKGQGPYQVQWREIRLKELK